MKLKVRSQALNQAVRDLPDTSIELRPAADGRAQAIIRSGSQLYRIEVVWAGQGWPSEVRRAISEISRPWPRQLVIVAKRLSPGALDLLRGADANWVDEEGKARLVVPPGLVILREAPKEAKAKVAHEQFRWSRSAIEIVEYLLHHNVHEIRTGHVAAVTGWSPGQVSQILGAFDSMNWTERHGGRSGRRTWHELVEPGVTLDSWADAVSRPTHAKRIGHRTDRDLLRFAHMELGSALGPGGDWALTTWAGLQLITPFATATPALHVYVVPGRFARDLDEIMRQVGIREVEEGARIEFWEADFRLLTQAGKPHPLPVASTPRLYADLLGLRGRAADGAQHLRETVLGY